MRNNLYKIFTASLVFAITFTLSCEEKSDGKAKGSTEQIAAEQAAASAKAEEPASCEKVKLLESITNENGELLTNLEYDDKNRIVKNYSYIDGKTATITYSSDDLITVDTKKFVKKGKIITIGSDTLTINEDGYIVKRSLMSDWTYKYENGNLTKDGYDDDHSINYTYDDKKSPFSNSNTPKWLLQYLFEYVDASKNNVIRYSSYGEVTSSGNYKYEYDSEGFPIQRTEEGVSDGEEYTTIRRLTYRTADCKGGAKYHLSF